MTVKARDGGTPPLEGLCTFRVIINAINDHSPEFDTETGQYVANITVERQPKVSFLAIRAYDRDVGTNSRINYSLLDDADGKFGIITENGFIYLNQVLTQVVRGDHR